jgi:hypothetical protein
MRRWALLLGSTILVSVQSVALAQVEGDSSWALAGELMVAGSATTAAEVRALPCPEIHAAIDAYNAGELRITPPPQDWEPAESIGHYQLTLLEIETLLAATDGSFGKDAVKKCSSPQPGWAAARVRDVGQSTVAGPVIRLVSGDPPGCDHGQIQMVGTEYVWDWVNGRWAWGYGRDWVDATQLVDPTGVVGRLTYLYACLTLAAPTEDFADIASQVPLTQVNHNPPLKGLTRLDTWLWYDFSDPTSHYLGPLDVSIDAYGRTWLLQAEAWVDRVMWNPTCQTGCTYRGPLQTETLAGWNHDLSLDLADSPTAPADSIDGGEESEEGAAAAFAYRTKGLYDFSAATVWRGAYSYNGVVYLYAPVVVTDAHPYQVVEVRSQLVAP